MFLDIDLLKCTLITYLNRIPTISKKPYLTPPNKIKLLVDKNTESIHIHTISYASIIEDKLI